MTRHWRIVMAPRIIISCAQGQREKGKEKKKAQTRKNADEKNAQMRKSADELGSPNSYA